MSRWIAALFILAAAPVVEAKSYAKVVYVAGCQTVVGSTALALYALWPTDAVAAPGWTPLVTTVVYCDAALPPNATAFDYVDFEYSWQPANPADIGPTVAAFVDMEVEQGDDVPYNMTVEVGECSASLATQGSQNSICRTPGSMSFVAPGGGLFQASVHLLVYFPPITDSTVSWAFRMVVHYEAP